MFRNLLKLSFHADNCVSFHIASQCELRNIFISYLPMCTRYISNKETCMDSGRKDYKRKPKDFLTNAAEEAICKLNVHRNFRYSSIQSYDLWITSVEIEWPEKIKLSNAATMKKLSLKIAAKDMLEMLTKKNIPDTGQLIYPPTFCPERHITNMNYATALPNVEWLSSRIYSEVSDESLSSSTSRSNSLGSLVNVRNYSSCFGFGRNCHNVQTLNDLVNRNMSVRTFHSSSSHDDTRVSDRVAVKRNAVDGDLEMSFSSNNIKAKRKKKEESKRKLSKKQKNVKVVPTLVNTCAVIEKENIAVKTKESGDIKNLNFSAEVYSSGPESEKNLEQTKGESDLSVTYNKECSINIAPGELEVLEGRYPHPKAILHNIYALVAQELNNSIYKLERSYHMVPTNVGKNMWNCTYRVKWPSESMFTSTMSTKALASKTAALKALYWLNMQGKLTAFGMPQMYDPKEIKEKMKIPTEVTVDPAIINDMDLLITYYNENIQPLLKDLQISEKTSKCSDGNEFDDKFMEDEDVNSLENLLETDESTNPVTGLRNTEMDSNAIARRNKQLYHRYLERTTHNERKENSHVLPITNFKSQIVKMVEENQVLVIKGEPGCGKSTQVPQYLMEHWEASRKGALCNIVITQPRRISAISLADWVAHERQERVGDVVGYQVRLKSALPKSIGGALLFCSTGILLRRLQSNPGLFGASHVILDEAHERDINTDMLLVLLRRALSLNHNLHLIIMSATINAELFQKYFGNSPAIHIPGFTYPVKSIFLDDLEVKSKISRTSENPEYPIIDCQLVADTINWIDKNRPEGAILCFLPGWAQISSVSNLLNENSSRCILPVHSRLSYAEQHRIFHVPPRGVRKIILSTNIAETSITINDVKYVVDTGAHKEERLNVHLGVSSLDNQWVSKANVCQRQGRAGRVQPGECFHLYTRDKFDSLDEFPIPELLRVPLEKTVLDLKTYSQDEKAIKFLSEMPEPPSMAAVIQAVRELYQLGALTENERLTPLGKRIALFTTHPKLSKALVLAAIFKCVSPMLTIATVLSGDAEVFIGGLNNKENVRLTKKSFHSSSDHISIAWVYQEWEMINDRKRQEANKYCDARSLNNGSLNLISKLRKLYSDHLWQSRMLDDSEDYKNLDSPSNKYAGNDEIVKAVFYSGTGTLLYRRNWDVKNGRMLKNVNVILTEAGRRATLSSESVNFKRKDFPSPFLTYFRQVESTERRTVTVRETSLLSPLSVLLFTEGVCVVNKFIAPSNEEKWENHMLLKINRNKRDVYFLCDSSVVNKLLDLRQIMWNMIDYFIWKNGVEDEEERYKIMCSYHSSLLKTLSSMLYRSGTMIEYDEEGNQCK